MKHLNHVCQPIQAAVSEGRIIPAEAIVLAYHYGHDPKVGMTVDDIVTTEMSPRPKGDHHCKPLIKLVAENRMTVDQAIEAAYKLGVEEREAVKVQNPEPEAPSEPKNESGPVEDRIPKETIVKRRGKRVNSSV